MASLYLVDDLAGVRPGDVVSLDGAEGRHAVTVARIRQGEALRIGDGRGTVVSGAVAEVGRDALTLAVRSVDVEPEGSPRLVLVQALAKGGRDEMAVQAATEIGVDGVVPWSAARSVSRWEGPKTEKGRARWGAIVREAAKQSLRARVPDVGPLVTTATLADGAGLPPSTTVLVLDPLAEQPLSSVAVPEGAGAIALVVGPEGGIADTEFDRLTDAGATRVRLGASVLRTSTAGPAALAVLQARLGRW
ncbi:MULTISPECIES: 16S rRNA (uracil(1498)-N(3))-methyltransferase [unclassified Curtobacterium]|uniref:16S rRNA (uracil(1498)-N(3))-methyltransferase n=1 Tax=unclassified Curtobacterium TaxID=257496 RepID=UPI000DA91ADA|nr:MULTISPECIES: 16S rRNA (uracil(1498)-N(3))-methyltransferase [unclassified Curtobacterium]PZE29954.1 16S rRNA (uracil(1498)-N(3))-methyltransferase [Curtobacterium sp. MCBD17_028]PZF66267.1 16S rRNA (uracil(1498)-N(3))-methyltransferase [Curtobacterium sp. MCBD17_013]WIB64816.1 16S rRNA (uracil(1498)-N(3))-methyltransferase [Curtobacterium sp. MCBD17_040]WIB68660.1 16S rRNA (uracil(1498)-N(3))-methyltransferase [Curtobacterium sp. MCBD17_035]